MSASSSAATGSGGSDDRFPLSIEAQTNIDRQIAQVLRMQELSQSCGPEASALANGENRSAKCHKQCASRTCA